MCLHREQCIFPNAIIVVCHKLNAIVCRLVINFDNGINLLAAAIEGQVQQLPFLQLHLHEVGVEGLSVITILLAALSA